MTLFEYLSVGYSIVLSLVVVRLLGGLPAALDRERRYWVHVLWLIYVLVRVLAFWWSFWSYREVATWSFFSFALVLLLPGLLYMMAVALIPDNSNNLPSWRDHYFAVHRRFFAIFATSLLLVVTTSVWLLNAPLVHRLRGAQAVIFGLALIGAFSSNRRIHAGLAIIIPLSLIPWMFFVFQEPGGFFQQPGGLPASP